jgi:hypothetical protein
MVRHRSRQQQRANAAERQRRTRARQKAGMVSLRLDVHEHDTADALVLAGRLSRDESLRPQLVARELERLVTEHNARWLSAVTRD